MGLMNIQQNISLAAHSTMGVGGLAAYLAEVNDRMELLEALSWAQTNNLQVIMIGNGSNIVWRDEGFAGLVIVDKILRFEIFEEDDTNVYLTIGGGEPWDSVVERSVAAGLTGIEAMSLIPGSTGATPIQNVGAYGQDIASVLVSVEAYDTVDRDFVTIPVTDCELGYRTSRFKDTDRGRFFISAITLHLVKGNPQAPFYGAVQTYFETNNITNFTPSALRTAVVAIRTSKLPDPKVVKNNGSFFANPIIDEYRYNELAEQYSLIPHWPQDDGKVKISAAWLIEQSGFKDYHDPETGMATWTSQPLVLVNESATSTAKVLSFRDKISAAVKVKFNIELEQEPELLPR